MISEVALIDGVLEPLAEARLAITDQGTARGDGAFETIGVWNGRPFRLPDHLERLDHSLACISLPKAPRDLLEADIASLMEGQEADGALRIYVTASGTRIVSLAGPPERTPLHHLVSFPAPWIRPLGTYGPASAKTMSYGPNMAASRSAQAAGGDDALLVAPEGWVLEGPTFAVLWMRDGVLHAPDLSLGLVDSISRRTVLEVADEARVPIVTGRYQLEHVMAADEVMTCSAVRELVVAKSIDGHQLPAEAPMTVILADALVSRRRGSP